VVASSALLWHVILAAVVLALGGYSTWRLGTRNVISATRVRDEVKRL
jgi:hypothetical protein